MGDERTAVDDYIAAFPAEVAEVLEQMRATMHAVVPDGGERISYQIPCITLDGTPLVHFAGWRSHLSVYPVPASDPVLDTTFDTDIAPYRSGKGTVRFAIAEPVPYDLIRRLTALLVHQRASRPT